MRTWTRIAILAASALPAQFATALAVNAGLFCEAYPAAGACVNGRVACVTCHDAGGPPALNPFGRDVLGALHDIEDFVPVESGFRQWLAEGLHRIEERDSDGDGFANLDEIARGRAPGDSQDKPSAEDPGAYDVQLAFKRMHVTYCGDSSRYEDNQALRAAADKRAFVHEALSRCLASSYWKDVALPRMGDEKIRPIASLGPNARFTIADYFYDYRLFTHALTDDRDARLLLTADFHVAPDGSIVRGVIPGRVGQPLSPEHRAGMMTTQWSIAFNTMFALVPRNTAAQAYRAYLGLDIARSEGLYPVPNEPRDLDHMQVGQEACAVCHSTLDPLSYAFIPYMAFANRRLDGTPRPRGIPIGGYDAGNALYAGDGYLFGEPVRDLVDWAQKAANSEAFRTNLARMFYKHALGRDAQTDGELREVEALARGLMDDGYSVNRMLHRMVDTLSFGAPGPAAAPGVAWKRHKAVARDLAAALAFDEATVCKELGRYSCTDEVFLAPLGGNDPFAKSQYRAAATTTATTPVALERVVLGACVKRVEADAHGTPVVFRALDLARPTVAGAEAAVDALTTDLYRRLLGRDPVADELTATRALMVDDAGASVSAVTFAKLACFAIGTSQEFVFN